MKRAFKYRIYPTKEQEESLKKQIEEARILYNLLLEASIKAYKEEKKSILGYDLNELALKIRKEKNLTHVSAQSAQDVAVRISKAFKQFFRKVKEGKHGKAVGYPRFKSFNRYDSITFPQYNNGFRLLDDDLLSVYDAGILKIKYLKDIAGKIKALTIKKEPTGNWYAIIIADGQFKNENHVCKSDKVVGMDVGLASFIATSYGELIENPKILKNSEKILKIRHRQLYKKKKGSKNRDKARIRLAKAYNKVKKQRETFLHGLTNKMIKNYKIIVIEKLNIKGMTKNHYLAKSILDASWNELARQLNYKAEEAGSVILQVDPRNTSKACSNCGWINNDLTLADRTFKCQECGIELNRDVNAARNILRLGLGTLGRRGTESNACGDEATTMGKPIASIVTEAGKSGSDLYFRNY